MWWHPLNPRWSTWAGKRIWVIGASSGIGAALARALLERGARVALSARRTELLEATGQGYPDALILPLDASDPQAWSSAHAALTRAWQGVDMVVFCAAAAEYRPQRAWELDADTVRRTLDINLASVYHGLQVVLPGLLAAGSGSVALVASVAGYIGLPNATIYGPTKAALINLAELLYADLHRRGIGVYLINPGFVKTRLTEKNEFPMPALQTPEQAAQSIIAGLARGRFEIDFPRRFTRLIKLLSLLPYRLSLAATQRLVSPS